MVSIISLLSLLAVQTVANPLFASNANVAKRSDTQSPAITACENASNCETYVDPNGKTKIRFKQGMEPGSKHYTERMASRDLQKRIQGPVVVPGHNTFQVKPAAELKPQIKIASGRKTQITLSDNQIWWGCGIDPVVTLGNLTSVCQPSGNCLKDSPWSSNVVHVAPGQPGKNEETLSITASGSYPTDRYEDMMKAVAGTASGLVTWANNVPVITPTRREIGPAGSTTSYCNVAQFSEEIDMSVYSADGNLEAFIQVSMTLVELLPGFCSKTASTALGLTGSIASGMGEAGAEVSAFTGFLSAFCNI